LDADEISGKISDGAYAVPRADCGHHAVVPNLRRRDYSALFVYRATCLVQRS
jgi:hypothetical protein